MPGRKVVGDARGNGDPVLRWPLFTRDNRLRRQRFWGGQEFPPAFAIGPQMSMFGRDIPPRVLRLHNACGVSATRVAAMAVAAFDAVHGLWYIICSSFAFAGSDLMATVETGSGGMVAFPPLLIQSLQEGRTGRTRTLKSSLRPVRLRRRRQSILWRSHMARTC